jgi:hypothetical protein
MDGLLLPGGAAPLSEGIVLLLDEIRHSAINGRFFPVWGTCLGFEFLLQYMGVTLESGFVASNVSWPLEQVRRHELYASDVVYNAVTQHSVTLHNHVLGLKPKTFANDPVLGHYWKVTSINHDARGVPFVSTIEPIDSENWPWYGVQVRHDILCAAMACHVLVSFTILSLTQIASLCHWLSSSIIPKRTWLNTVSTTINLPKCLRQLIILLRL